MEKKSQNLLNLLRRLLLLLPSSSPFLIALVASTSDPAQVCLLVLRSAAFPLLASLLLGSAIALELEVGITARSDETSPMMATAADSQSRSGFKHAVRGGWSG